MRRLDDAGHRRKLIVVAVLGKFAAGYAPFWFRGKKP